MKQIIANILTDILTALYEPFWFAVLASVLFMFLYLYAKEHGGFKESLKIWCRNLKKSKEFKKVFLFSFVTIMILFRTLLNRKLWLNPLSDVMGGWSIHEINASTGETTLNTECIENVIMFIPYILLLFWSFHKGIFKGILTLKKVLVKSFCISFFSSLTIETLQLLLRLGTFQISDLTYNTLGGIIGGIIYFLLYKTFSNIDN